jgi:flagellum-specific ATP synthase
MSKQELLRAVNASEIISRTGQVVAVRGQLIEASGPAVQVGERCRIDSLHSSVCIDAEVVGFDRGTTLLMPFRGLQGVSFGERVMALGEMPQIPVGAGLLGRVIDAFGTAMDGGPAIAGVERRAPLLASPPPAMTRARVREPMETGIKVIDAMMPLALGQRVGLFSGSGVGKSSLMGMLSRDASAPVKVIALIGERSREIREFVEDQLGHSRGNAVIVAATADESAVVRCRAAYAATAIAEYFRDQGADVLLLVDSLTRFAMARREIALNMGEPPTSRGYTPSIFAELPQLCERAGCGARGSITGIYTVLVEGDDMNEPVSDTLRATLDGHIVLSRELANAGQYPAVDVLQSLSRLHNVVAGAEELSASRKVLACCALYERNRQLIEIGAHKPGIHAALDRAVQLMPDIRAFFAQQTGHRVRRAAALTQLKTLAAAWSRDDENR